MKIKLPLLGILLLAFGLRLHGLADLSLWLDESYSVYAARLPLPDLLQFVISRSHPPLYFVLLHAWLRVGSGEFVLRFLSVAWGMIGVAGLYGLARRLVGERGALAAALLLAVSPIHVWHSQDARMYTQLFALAVLSSWLLLEATRRGGWVYWAGYALAAALMLYSHNTAVLTLAAQGLFCVVLTVRQRRWPAVVRGGAALAAVALLYLPWLPLAAAQAGHLQQHFWPAQPTPRAVLDTLDYLSSAFLFTDSPWGTDLDAWPGALLYLVFAGLLLLGAWRLARRSPRDGLFLGLLIALPIAGEYAASLVSRPVYVNRTLLVAAAPLWIVYAAGGLAGRRAWRAAWLGLLLAALALNAASLVHMDRTAGKEEWRQAAALVAAEAGPDDVILFDQGLIEIPFDYYYQGRGPALPELGYPYEYTHWEIQPALGEGEWWVADYVAADPEAALTRLAAAVEPRGTVWLVVNRPMSENRLLGWLQAHSLASREYPFYRVTVYRFERRAGG